MELLQEFYSYIFLLNTGIIKKYWVQQEIKKEHVKILVIAKSKLNTIVALVSPALFDMEISPEECITILNEKYKYEKMKENLRNINWKLKEKNEYDYENKVMDDL